MIMHMTRAIALARALQHDRLADALRTLIVCGCALALMAADRALPF
jgi:hypothetical protein